MWLKIRQNFNDDRDKFYRGERRWVEPEERARNFIANAWAEADETKPDAGGAAPTGARAVDLQVQSGKIGTGDTYDG